MGLRTALQVLLESLIDSGEVYFQPPETVKLSYPCVVYELSSVSTRFADNAPYDFHKRYQITLITRDPDDHVVDELLSLPMCVFDRRYSADNLNHFVFQLYF